MTQDEPSEVHRSPKPVVLKGDIRRTFVRSGGGGVRCSDHERNGLLIDAAAERPDGQAVDLNPATAFDPDAIRWYRAVYEARPGNRSCAAMSDADFLAEMGLLVEQGGRRLPTRAAVLIFGTNPAFRQLLPRPVVDCQWFTAIGDDADTGDRWFDRLVLDENLIRAWRSLIEDWYERFAEHPFRLDPATLRRDDTPPDYRAFRESMINLIMHQDYSDHSRKAVIRHYADKTVLWNPGDAFAGDVDLLEPGEREMRNPRIVLAFRRIGLGEHAGWGLRDVFRNWQQLGHVPPQILSDRRRKSFELVLKKEALLSERQIAFQWNLGIGLMDEEARALALACREQHVRLWQIKAVTGLSGLESAAVAEQLVNRTLIERVGSDEYVLARRLRDRIVESDQVGDQVGARVGDMVSDQVGPSHTSIVTGQATRQMTAHQRRIIDACDVPRSLVDLTKRAGVTHRTFFRRKHLQPLVDAGIVRMTNPDKQTAANQRYVLTEAGAAIKAARIRISACKPNSGLEDCFRSQAAAADGAWDFVRTHMRQLPVFVAVEGRAEVIAERQSHLLFDRMVAFHVQRGAAVPLSAAQFHEGLTQRFPERDGMFFLPEQVAEYDPRRLAARELAQLEIFVRDEETAIQWLRQQLARKPQTFQEIHPRFIRELGGWRKHERMIELSEFLEQNFLRYDGRGEVPRQIHAYLSGYFKELRNLSKAAFVLRAKAKDRWYVPDPRRAGDLDEPRTRGLLREFDGYRHPTERRLKSFRLEAVRAGFLRAWQARDYATIIEVASKIPEDAFQEDPKLLMWYDQALTCATGKGA